MSDRVDVYGHRVVSFRKARSCSTQCISVKGMPQPLVCFPRTRFYTGCLTIDRALHFGFGCTKMQSLRKLFRVLFAMAFSFDSLKLIQFLVFEIQIVSWFSHTTRTESTCARSSVSGHTVVVQESNAINGCTGRLLFITFS